MPSSSAPAKPLRLDKYLWAIRIFKTRSLAAKAISEGKATLDGKAVKPSKEVRVGEQYDIKTEGKRWIIEVVNLLERRLSADLVKPYFLDHSPPPPPKSEQPEAFFFPTGKRNSKVGRPTKKVRRNLDQYLSD
jgi:ribosome-associated heat shock protein Hsp15